MKKQRGDNGASDEELESDEGVGTSIAERIDEIETE